MRRRTKIVCTLGPAVQSREQVRDLIQAGMNVARLNCSHGDWETRRSFAAWVRELSPELAPIGLLVDLQGPKFRLGMLPPEGLALEAGQTVTVGQGPDAQVPIHQPEVLDTLCEGCRLLLGDGEVELKIVGNQGDLFLARSATAGIVRSRKGVTVVGKRFSVPALTDRDRADIRTAAEIGADFIALSYVHSAEDIEELRREVGLHDRGIRLCAKIETRDAVRSIDDIIQASDLVMVARGDMGLQMEIEEVPMAQKRIIERCTRAGVPVITATQMLESMVVNPRPTRAEATDVFNAVLDGTDAVMLSAETAAGAHPVEAVRYMSRIAERAESQFDHHAAMELAPDGAPHQTEAVAHAAARLAHDIRAKAIVSTSTSGQTPRLVSKFRPRAPILCATWSEKTYRQMSCVWGVESLMIPPPATTDEIVQHALIGFQRCKRLKQGDPVVVTAGVPAGTPGNTNLVLTQVVK